MNMQVFLVTELAEGGEKLDRCSPMALCVNARVLWFLHPIATL